MCKNLWQSKMCVVSKRFGQFVNGLCSKTQLTGPWLEMYFVLHVCWQEFTQTSFGNKHFKFRTTFEPKIRPTKWTAKRCRHTCSLERPISSWDYWHASRRYMESLKGATDIVPISANLNALRADDLLQNYHMPWLLAQHGGEENREAEFFIFIWSLANTRVIYCAFGPTLAASAKLMCKSIQTSKKQAEQPQSFWKWGNGRDTSHSRAFSPI